jgi:hypothetical protein
MLRRDSLEYGLLPVRWQTYYGWLDDIVELFLQEWRDSLDSFRSPGMFKTGMETHHDIHLALASARYPVQ